MRIFLRLSSALTTLAIAVAGSSQTTPRRWVSLQQDLPMQIQRALPIGPKALSDTIHIAVTLPFADPQGVQNFVDSVSNPKSPNYRKFLTPEQVGSRFGLPASSVKKVADYLTAQGMKVKLVGKNRLSILADATVAQAQSAFNVSIKEYRATLPGTSEPTTCFASSEAPSLPVEISPFVQYIGGIENFVRPQATQTQTPSQLQTLYNVSPLLANGFYGQGRTVAISNWVTYGLFNIPLEYKQWSLPTPAGGVGSNVSVVSIDGSNGETTGSPGVEADIDIQCVLNIAPLCNLIIYDNNNNSDLIGVLTQEVDDNKADLITESYAWNGPTSLFVASHNLHLSMSAQGITYLCASGDWGAPGVASLYYPDEDPEVLSVGGTTVTTDNSGNRQSEVVWDWGFSSGTGTGGGGGWCPNTDPFNLLPSYQKGTGVPANIPYRLVPDISMDADPDSGYYVYLQGNLASGWGGTSCASPTAAGALAVCEQMIIANGGLPADSSQHQRFGRINDLIYSINGDPSVFYDVTSGSDGNLPNGVLSSAGIGWDTASGWGAPNFAGLASWVLSYPPITQVTLLPTTVVGGNSTTATIHFANPVGAATATLNLASSSPSASVPATLSVKKGATSATFTVNTAGVATSTPATITATLGGSTQSVSLTVTPASLQTLSLAPNTVVGGNTTTATVNLSGQAGTGGATVTLETTSSAATVPASVTIPAGSSSITFNVSTVGQANPVSSTIMASYSGVYQSATLNVTAASLSTVTISPNPLFGGTSATGTVSLTGAAPPGGVTVTLTAAKATVPKSVAIPAGASSITFPVTTQAVAKTTSATITAKSGTQTAIGTISILAPSLTSLAVAPNSVVGGSKTAGTVTFNGPAPAAGEVVTLTSSNTLLATVPSSVKVLSGATSITFTVTSKAVAITQKVTVTATYGGVSQSATLTIQPAGLSAISVSPATVKGSATTAVTGTVSISGPAPATGLVVTLLSSNTSAATVPATVTIPSGKTSITFKVSHKKVTNSTAITLSGSVGQTTVSTTLTVTP